MLLFSQIFTITECLNFCTPHEINSNKGEKGGMYVSKGFLTATRSIKICAPATTFVLHVTFEGFVDTDGLTVTFYASLVAFTIPSFFCCIMITVDECAMVEWDFNILNCGISFIVITEITQGIEAA